MSQTLAVRDLKIGNWILSVTTRDAGDDSKLLEELTYRTIMTWVNIVRRLEKENYVYEGISVEQSYADEINKHFDTDAPKKEPFEFRETFGDSRVTVWSTFRGVDNPNFHLNSDDVPQVAIDTWRANQLGSERAVVKLESLLPKNAPQPIQTAEQQAQQQFNDIPSANKPQTPQTPNSAVEGVIVATQRPNPNTPQYTNGQLVSFTVTKIVATSNKGSAVYQMWTPLGNQYPTINVYKLKPDGSLKKDFEAIVPILNTLNLTLDKPEAVGTWRLVCKASHVPSKDNSTDKEYLNVVSLTAI